MWFFFLGWNFANENRPCSQLEYHAHSFLLDILNHVTPLAFQLGSEKQGPTPAEEAERIKTFSLFFSLYRMSQ